MGYLYFYASQKFLNMKRFILLFLVLTSGVALAQTTENETENCYQKYAKVFETRGANPVENGWHEDVIITIRQGSHAECFMGKAQVVNGAIPSTDIYLKFQDGTYEQVKRIYKHDDIPCSIVNGISRTLVTSSDELINVMFVKAVKPKKKAYERAPEPTFDF